MSRLELGASPRLNAGVLIQDAVTLCSVLTAESEQCAKHQPQLGNLMSEITEVT